MTIADVAKRLGASVHRVTRAIERLGIMTTSSVVERGRPPHVLDDAGFARLLEDLGAAPSVDGYTREDLFVLAAFNMNPFGFRSRRAVATASGVSPTTASAVVDRLIDVGLVKAVSTLVRNNGGVVTGAIFEANRDSEKWNEIMSDVLSTHPPMPQAVVTPKIVPRRFWHLFWNASPAQLPIVEHADYIASRMLLSGDALAVSWAITHLPIPSIEMSATLREASDDDKRWLLRMADARRKSVSV